MRRVPIPAECQKYARAIVDHPPPVRLSTAELALRWRMSRDGVRSRAMLGIGPKPSKDERGRNTFALSGVLETEFRLACNRSFKGADVLRFICEQPIDPGDIYRLVEKFATHFGK